MGGRLEGKVAVITGATSGIGEAAAMRFAAEGAQVVLAGRSTEKGEELVRALGGSAIFQRTDVLLEKEIEALLDVAVDRFGRVDCLFNNAGAPSRGTLESVTEEDFDYSMRLLVGSVVFGIKHAARVMKPRRSGSIINNSSIAAHRTGQGVTFTPPRKPRSAISPAWLACNSACPAFVSMQSLPEPSPPQFSGEGRSAPAP